MRKIVTLATLIGASLALTACGGSERPRHAGQGPHGDVIVPAAAPSIHFKVTDAQGNALDLMIECGADTALDKCAKVNQDIIDTVSKIRSNAKT